jgi:hypothetical protein
VTLEVVDEAGCSSEVTLPVVPGEMPEEPSALDLDPSVAPLRVSKWALDLELRWEDLGAGTLYHLYRGTIGDYYSHGEFGRCDMGAPTTPIPYEVGSHYFIAVEEGCEEIESSYGRSSAGAERPDAATASGGPCP